MARNGSGVFNPLYNWNDDKAAGIKITASRMQDQDADMATALTDSLSKDGQTTPTDNLPMGGFKHTDVGNGSARDEYLTLGQYQDRSAIHVAESGTANAYALSPVPAVAGYVTGQVFRFTPGNTNSAASTLNVSSLGAKSLKKGGTTDVVSGDIVTGRVYEAFYDGTNFQLFNLSGMYNNATSGMTATTVQGALDELKSSLTVTATSRILGRKSAGAGNIEECTLSQVLDMVGSAADGDILYRSGGVWTRLAKGTGLQTLRMNSGATALEWATPDSVPANYGPAGYVSFTTSGGVATIQSSAGTCSGCTVTRNSAGQWTVAKTGLRSSANAPILVSGTSSNAGAMGVLTSPSPTADSIKVYATTISGGATIYDDATLMTVAVW